MRCPNCGYEGESRFCPECGTPMEEYLPAAEPASGGPTGTGPAGGEPAGAGPAYIQPAPGKRSIKKIIIIVVVAVAAVLIAAIIALAVIMRGLTDHPELLNDSDGSSATTSEEVDSDDLFSDDEEAVSEDAVSGDDEDIASVETQGKELPGGTYVVGEDISAGKYNFTYTTEMSEDDYWSNDYFYITRAGSEGSEETLGGTKFDERFGSIDYESAKAGKTFYANLKSGDKLLVDSEFGNWTY